MIRQTMLLRSKFSSIAMAAGVALAASSAFVALPASAAPQTDKSDAATQCAGRGVPESKIGFQLYSARTLINQIGLEPVLAMLADIGYKEVQFAAAVGSYNVPVEEMEALLKKYDLKASSGQAAYNETSFSSAYLPYAKEIGHKYTGSGGFGQPGTQTLADTLATAEQMNRLGELSVKNGTGKLFGHNHDGEFLRKFPDPQTGEMKSAWQLLVENTDPRYVTFEVDVFWAEAAGIDVASLLDEYGDRIELLHIKDSDEPFNWQNQTVVGEGAIDWAPILDAAQGKVKYYVIERDNGNESIQEYAKESFEFLSCFSY